MHVLAVILARAGSKGLPGKATRPLCGRAMIEYTIDHALVATQVDAVVVSTDCPEVRRISRVRGVEVIDRPAELATDTARVDEAARHAVQAYETQRERAVDVVVLLYGNVPVRQAGVIDRAVRQLIHRGGDSVRTVAAVGAHHPDWLHRVDGDRMAQYRPNAIYRRQDLDPLFYHDAAVAVVRRAALFSAAARGEDGQAFLGRDRRALVQEPQDAVDVDTVTDLRFAEVVLRSDVGQPVGSAPAGSAAPGEVHIGGRLVGGSAPTYVIAEAGVNHNGHVETALRMIDAAALTGADAVKFQVFRAADLTTAGAPLTAYQRAQGQGTSQFDMLERLELSRTDWVTLRDHCRTEGIEFIATPFSVTDVTLLNDLNVAAIKMASTDLNNVPLLRRAAESGRPLIVSTGASIAEEVRTAVGFLNEACRGRLVLLHCVSCYPTRWQDTNLRRIRTLADEFGVPVGFSDHTVSAETGALAAAAGACVLEKHFTLDGAAPGPDQAMSLEPQALTQYIRKVRRADVALGGGDLGMINAERDVRRVARQSVVAGRDIEADEVLAADMLTCKRPGGGLEPSAIDRLVGRRARVAIPADTPITWEAVR